MSLNRSRCGSFAASTIAAENVIRSAPDGHTLFFISSAITVAPAVYNNLKFDVEKDLQAIAGVGALPVALMVTDSLPVHEKARAEQLIADARKAVEEQAPVDRVRPLAADLQQIIHSLPAAASAAAGPGDGGAPHGGNDDDEVVDADFTRG